MRNRTIEILALGAILTFAIIVRVALIDRPFHRDAEGCGSFYGLLARNYWRYDLAQTRGVPVMSMGIVERPTFYKNHPPLVPILIAGALGIAGYTQYSNDFPPDWLIRLPTVPFTIGCIVLVWWILRRGGAPRAGLIAAAVFASVPMTLVFGGLVDVISTQLVFFILLTVIAYLRFHATPSFRWLALMTAAFFPAAITDWPAFFLVPVLVGHFVLTRPARQWAWIIAFAAISVICFLIPYAQVVLVTGDWLWMSHLVKRRALSNVSDANAAFTLGDWLRGALYGHAIVRHTWVVMILAMMWIIWSIARVTRRQAPAPGTRPTALLLGWAILHIAVGRQGVFVHEWWWWPLTPGVALAAGLMIDRMCAWLETRGVGHVVTNCIVALMLIAFAAWHTRHAVDELGRPKVITADIPAFDYPIDEIGQVIRESAPPNAVVMLAENDSTLSLWYYADRPLRTDIWDAWTFEQRLADDSSELPFHLRETHRGRAVAFIFPKAYVAPKTESFLRYLRSRYPMRDTGKFYVFELTRPSP